MNNPNNLTCYICGVKCETYDEYVFTWKYINDKADFCRYCIEEVLQNFYDCNMTDIKNKVPSIEVRDMIVRSKQKRGEYATIK